MEKDEDKSTVADQFVGERTVNLEGGRVGYGRVNSGVPIRVVQCSQSVLGSTMYLGHARPSGQLGVFKIFRS